MAYDAGNGTLYVTDDYNNAIYALPNALTATGPVAPVMIAQGGALDSPQGIVIDPVNHMLLVVNGAGNNNLVELASTGKVMATRVLDSGSGGALFGLATSSMNAGHLGIYFDDSNTSTLDELSASPIGYRAYQLATANGVVSAFGVTSSAVAPKVSGKVVAMADAAGSNGGGYWEVTANGMVYAAGSAKNYGGLGNVRLNAPIVGIASTPDGKGYWLVGADGGVFNFGDAGYYGNTYSDGLTGLRGMHPLNMPILGIISTPDGAGYWLVAKDGGVFNFGDAGFSGSGAGKGMTFTAAAGPLL